MGVVRRVWQWILIVVLRRHPAPAEPVANPPEQARPTIFLHTDTDTITPEKSNENSAASVVALAPQIATESHKPSAQRAPNREPDIFLKRERPKRTGPALPRPKRKLYAIERDPEPEPDKDDDGEWHWKYGREDVEQSGTFYFRGALLNHLPRYFEVLERMKRGHRDGFELYSRIGATLVPMPMLLPVHRLPAHWRDLKLRPSFGAVAISLEHDDTAKTFWPRLCFFNKLNPPPPYVEPFDGDVYEYVSYFDTQKLNDGKKWPKWIREGGFVSSYHVGVDKAGGMRALKHLQTRYQHIRYRAVESHATFSNKWSNTNGHSGKTKSFTEHIPYKLWDLPPHIVDWFNDHKDRHETLRNPNDWACSMFCMMASMAAAHETGIRIEVTDKHEMTASFAVDMKRTAYFFKDRDIVLNAKGKRARIFHIVRPHTKTLKSGKEVVTRMHFRGARSFPWAGYQVHLTVPGLHHDLLTEIHTDLMDSEAAQAMNMPLDDIVGTDVIAKMLRHLVHGERDKAKEVIDNAPLWTPRWKPPGR